jgi:hypothetical protein
MVVYYTTQFVHKYTWLQYIYDSTVYLLYRPRPRSLILIIPHVTNADSPNAPISRDLPHRIGQRSTY